MECELYSLKHPNSQISEVYRGIRTNIEYANLDKQIKTINITSTAAGEAKSTTAANLAVMCANKYKRVLLIDLDLRNPSAHRLFKIKNEKGLTNYLIEQSETENIIIDDYIQKFVHKNITNDLYVLTAGQEVKNPTEVLESKRIKSLLTLLKNEFDIIIIDSAPSGVIADGVVSSRISDGTVYVVESGRTRIELAQKTLKLLRSLDVNILGVVLTKAPVQKSTYGNYGEYYQTKDNDRLRVEV